VRPVRLAVRRELSEEARAEWGAAREAHAVVRREGRRAAEREVERAHRELEEVRRQLERERQELERERRELHEERERLERERAEEPPAAR
jgi:uncharacterized membrane protein